MWWHRSTRQPLVKVGLPEELVKKVLVSAVKRKVSLFMRGSLFV